MLHKMRLKEDPFERIKNGTKTVEFRLYDEKRKNIKIGDKIEFSKLSNQDEKLLVEVLDLYISDSFENLFRKLGLDEKEIIRKVDAMNVFYSKEEEKEFGVLGIKIRVTDSNNNEE